MIYDLRQESNPKYAKYTKEIFRRVLFSIFV
jgi:hypothetical protein